MVIITLQVFILSKLPVVGNSEIENLGSERENDKQPPPQDRSNLTGLLHLRTDFSKNSI
jgi:hypothetical protein